MKIGIMQPYFWPYLGYFQLINAVDKFVIYDNIKYTKKGWFNRNRYLCNGIDRYFTIPLEKGSDFLDVRDRRVSQSFDREKIKSQIKSAYCKSPYFKEIYPLFCACIEYENFNLFEFIFYSVLKIVKYLEIDTEIIVSSSLNIGHEVRGKEKVLAICKKLEGTQYINPIGGQGLYNKEEFDINGIKLFFLKMEEGISYTQFNNKFVPSLSILDVLMFNSVEEIKVMLNRYKLI